MARSTAHRLARGPQVPRPFFFSSRRRHTRCSRDWSSDVCSSDLWTTGSAAVPVAVLDTGVTAHPELHGAWLPGADMVSDPVMANDGSGRDLDPTDPGDWVSASERAQDTFSTCESHDSSWHGTIVSGILAARTDNNEGVAAVGWNARIVPVRVAGKCGAEVADIVDGMRWAAGLWVRDGRRGWLPLNPNPVRVISLSFGGN